MGGGKRGNLTLIINTIIINPPLLGKNSFVEEFVPLPETYAKLGIFCLCVCVSETLNGERDTFAKNVATFRRSDPLEESIDDRRDRPMIDRRWIEDLTLGLIRN